MSDLKILAAVCIFALAFAFTAGCVGNELNTDMTGGSPEAQSSGSKWPAGGSSAEYTVDNELPSDLKVEVSASKADKDSILIKYTLDLTSMGTAMKHEGWEARVTAYAYNPEKTGEGFSVKSYDDVISGGIPYQSRNILFYPSNRYPDQIAISINPDTKMTLDTRDYYIYGIVLTAL